MHTQMMYLARGHRYLAEAHTSELVPGPQHVNMAYYNMLFFGEPVTGPGKVRSNLGLATRPELFELPSQATSGLSCQAHIPHRTTADAANTILGECS